MLIDLYLQECNLARLGCLHHHHPLPRSIRAPSGLLRNELHTDALCTPHTWDSCYERGSTLLLVTFEAYSVRLRGNGGPSSHRGPGSNPPCNFHLAQRGHLLPEGKAVIWALWILTRQVVIRTWTLFFVATRRPQASQRVGKQARLSDACGHRAGSWQTGASKANLKISVWVYNLALSFCLVYSALKSHRLSGWRESGRERSLPDGFSRQTEESGGPTRRQLQGIAPGTCCLFPGTPSSAVTPLPPPPSPHLGCAPARPALGPWAGCSHGPPPGQAAANGKARPRFATPPLCHTSWGSRGSRVCVHLPPLPSLLLCYMLCGGGRGRWRWGVSRQAWMEEGAFPRKRKEVSVTVCTLGDC